MSDTGKPPAVGDPSNESARPQDTRALGDSPYDRRLPYDKVPVSAPRGYQEGERPIESRGYLINPPATLPNFGALVGGGSSQGLQAGFLANACKIDNLTSSWVLIPELGAWVPPFWVGRVLQLSGAQRVSLRFETPPGITAQVVDQTQLVRFVFSNADWEEVDGESLSAAIAGLAATVNQGLGGASIDVDSWWVKIGDGATGPVKVGTSAPGVADKGLVTRLPNATSYNSGVAASGVIKNAAGTLYGGVFMNSNAATRYLQIFDSATVPADGATPLLSIPVPAGTAFPFGYIRGRAMANGIAWCTSTTFATKTLGAADAIADMQFE